MSVSPFCGPSVDEVPRLELPEPRGEAPLDTLPSRIIRFTDRSVVLRVASNLLLGSPVPRPRDLAIMKPSELV
jgi:hypothetical protein